MYVIKFLIESGIYNFSENKYPYNIEENIKHYLFWINPKSNEILNIFKINSIIQNYLKKPYIIFENLPDNKSVPEIKHYHVFFKI